jgi:serine/threonine-protein kinase HipA
MSVNEKSLRVFLIDNHVGHLTQHPNGGYRFEYLADWRSNPRHIPLSRSMPLQQQRHGMRPIANFMWGLLPDNELILNEWVSRFRVSPRNPFALLAVVGGGLPRRSADLAPEF